MSTPTPEAIATTHRWLARTIPTVLPASMATFSRVDIFGAVVQVIPADCFLSEAVIEDVLATLVADGTVQRVRDRDGETMWRRVVPPEALRLAAIDEIVTAWERTTPSTPMATREAMVAIADVLHGKAPTTVAIRERYCLDAARATIEEVRDLVGAGATETTVEAVRRYERDAENRGSFRWGE